MELRTAERKQAKIKMGLQGPSGSGKTYSSLLLAYGLVQDWSRIAVIDTENHSSDLYAHLGAYNVLHLDQPFAPERYVDAIETCENASMEVVIIDSITHEWDGAGGVLESHGNMPGNSFTNWSKITPRHNGFVQKILQSPCHIIATVRTKQDYVLSEKNGKYVPEKIGLKGITRDGLDYEFTIMFDLDIKHHATCSKDRSGLFVDSPSFIISRDTGKKIKQWCGSGTSNEAVISKIYGAVTLEELRSLYHRHPEFRRSLSQHFTKRKSELLNGEEDNLSVKPENE